MSGRLTIRRSTPWSVLLLVLATCVVTAAALLVGSSRPSAIAERDTAPAVATVVAAVDGAAITVPTTRHERAPWAVVSAAVVALTTIACGLLRRHGTSFPSTRTPPRTVVPRGRGVRGPPASERA